MTAEESEKNQGEQLILVIANRPKAFESAANFLSRRGLPCSIISDVKQGLKIITQRRPAYIFLSWNLKNANIQKTMALFSKTFKVVTVLFAESTDSKTAAELAASGYNQIMQAPVSGPGMYMRIQKIIKSRDEEEASIAAQRATMEAAITREKIEASEIPAEGHWEAAGREQRSGKNVWKFKAEQPGPAAKKGTITFRGEKAPEKGKDGGWKVDPSEAAELTVESQGTFEAAGLFEGPPKFKDKSNSQSGTVIEIEAPELESQLTDQDLDALAAQLLNENRPAPAKVEPQMEEGYGSIMKIGANRKDRAPGMRVEPAETETREPGLMMFGKDKQGKDHLLTQEGRKDGPGFNLTQSGPKGKDHIIGQTTKSPARMSGRNFNSILAKSTAQALEDAVAGSSGETVEISSIKRAFVIAIKTPRFSGYLLATSSNSTSLDPSVVNTLKAKVFDYLHEAGEEPTAYENVECNVEEVDFRSWSEVRAEFVATAEHHNEQWALAFISNDNGLPKTERTEDGSMIAVELHDVLPEKMLSFDLFLYLPINSRYFKYVRSGQPIQSQQKSRMESHDVRRFFIRPEDLPAFKKFCIENNLNAEILSFNSQRSAV